MIGTRKKYTIRLKAFHPGWQEVVKQYYTFRKDKETGEEKIKVKIACFYKRVGMARNSYIPLKEHEKEFFNELYRLYMEDK